MISGQRAYRRNLPHYQNDFQTYFVTFITEDRWILPPAARDLVMKHILFDHGRRMALHPEKNQRFLVARDQPASQQERIRVAARIIRSPNAPRRRNPSQVRIHLHESRAKRTR